MSISDFFIIGQEIFSNYILLWAVIFVVVSLVLSILFAPDVLTLLAYQAGAFVISAKTIVGLFFVADYFGRWF